MVGLHVERRGEYEWRVRDELAVGGLLPEDAARAFAALLGETEAAARDAQGAPVDLRPRVLSALPRAAAAFGRLYSLEVLQAMGEADGATAVELRVALEPERLRPSAPGFAWFLDKYVTPIELRAVASGTAGSAEEPRLSGVTPIWSLHAVRRRATLRLRVHDRQLAPAGRASATYGNRIRVALDYSTRSGPFRVGVSGLEADVALVGTPREKSFTASFRQEPEWRVPFLIRPLLRGSLKRPFEGEGSSLSYALAQAEGVTRLERSYRLPVKESWIVRWIGGLTSSSVSDFRRQAEAESDQFTADGLGALRQDLETLLR